MYVAILSILILIALILFISKNAQLTKGVKLTVVTILVIATLLQATYEWLNLESAKRIKPIVLAFKSGKTLICEDKKIDNKSYIYESGTSSLFPKEGVIGDTYSIAKCKIQK